MLDQVINDKSQKNEIQVKSNHNEEMTKKQETPRMPDTLKSPIQIPVQSHPIQ